MTKRFLIASLPLIISGIAGMTFDLLSVNIPILYWWLGAAGAAFTTFLFIALCMKGN